MKAMRNEKSSQFFALSVASVDLWSFSLSFCQNESFVLLSQQVVSSMLNKNDFQWTSKSTEA